MPKSLIRFFTLFLIPCFALGDAPEPASSALFLTEALSTPSTQTSSSFSRTGKTIKRQTARQRPVPAPEPVNQLVKHWAKEMAWIVGVRMGRSPAEIRRVIRKTRVHTIISLAQSYSMIGHIVICLPGSITDPDTLIEALRSVASEVGHSFHQVLVETRKGRTKKMSLSAKETYDRAASMIFMNEIDRRRARKERRGLKEDATQGGYLIAAAIMTGISLDRYEGGDTPKSRKLFEIIFELALRDSAQYTWSTFAEFMREVARNFFRIIPGDPKPGLYGGAHMSGAFIYQQLLNRRNNDPREAALDMGAALDTPHLGSVDTFMNFLLNRASQPARQEGPEFDYSLEKLEASKMYFKNLLRSIREKPIRIKKGTQDAFALESDAQITKIIFKMNYKAIVNYFEKSGLDLQIIRKGGPILKSLKKARKTRLLKTFA